MALTTTPLGDLFAHAITQETDIEHGGYTHVRGAPVTLGYMEFVAAGAGYVKLYDNDGEDMLFDGSDPADIIINIPAAQTINCIIKVEGKEGLPFVNGLTFAASQVAGDDLTDAPAASIVGRFVTRQSK